MSLINRMPLRLRLIFVGLVLLLTLLGVVGVGISRAFQDSVLTNAEGALRNQILLVLSAMEVVDGQVEMPSMLSEPRLNQPNSELFAQITDFNKQWLWRSGSLLDDHILINQISTSEISFIELADLSTGDELFASQLNVEWETDDGILPFTVQVAESTRPYTQRLQRYNQQVLTLLGILAALILLTLSLLFVWFLRPIARISREVGEVESGDRVSFNEDYPVELNRLTQNLNQLLQHEEKRISRQKEVLGNLAHSLKTPLAILRGLAFDKETKNEAETQIDNMQSIIEYQLQSASTVGRRHFSKPISIYQVTRALVASLEKLYLAKGVTINLEINEEARFYGDEGDWQELLGNLLDNACKWAKSRVDVEIRNRRKSDSLRQSLSLIVVDDGVGMPEDQQRKVLQRGVRLDSQTPGHGLGLSIVKGIVDAYDAKLTLENGAQGGLQVRVLFN
ncbi:MAG: ATP-binding protein [Pseudomonadota bacterium]